MINPKRYAVSNGALVESDKGTLVSHDDFVAVVAHSIEGAANKEFLERQVPALKKALVDILSISAAFDDSDMEQIRQLAAKALVS